MKLLKGRLVATVCPPEASAEEIRSYESKRGQAEKGRKGGRPRKTKPGAKKQKRIDNLPKVIELKKQGHSLREIGASLGVAHSSIAGWLEAIK